MMTNKTKNEECALNKENDDDDDDDDVKIIHGTS